MRSFWSATSELYLSTASKEKGRVGEGWVKLIVTGFMDIYSISQL
jgi:hypothetical protein